ncbi:MAG: nicotinate-nucleotide adenylyltransferase [Salinisphaeraceae bacterium]|nr:nicotinate-nucleotide adenylyltransferase [Salinisphaeraceae bacterium]
MSELKPPIGILGGTFDPIHNGHLRLALQLRDKLGLESIRLIPSARPPHRNQPGASPGQRAKWIRVAIAGEPGLQLDDRELIRPGKSYTVDTLKSLREDLPDTPLCLIMGSDVLAELSYWDRWEELVEYAHIIGVPRPGFESPMSREMREWVAKHECTNPVDLRNSLGGKVYLFELPLLDISGTRIRETIATGNSPRYLLPEDVMRDINELGTYKAGSSE